MKDIHTIQQYVLTHIPLSGAMGVQVEEATPNKVVLSAPLAPNINHRDTVFGGSASALCILSAWTLVHFRLEGEGYGCRVVIQNNTMAYDRPIPEGFKAVSILDDEAKWEKFTRILSSRKKARIVLNASLECGGKKAGLFEGTLVAAMRSASPE